MTTPIPNRDQTLRNLIEINAKVGEYRRIELLTDAYLQSLNTCKAIENELTTMNHWEMSYDSIQNILGDFFQNVETLIRNGDRLDEAIAETYKAALTGLRFTITETIEGFDTGQTNPRIQVKSVSDADKINLKTIRNAFMAASPFFQGSQDISEAYETNAQIVKIAVTVDINFEEPEMNLLQEYFVDHIYRSQCTHSLDFSISSND